MKRIPSVRRWRATYWRAGKVLFVHETAAPTKLFARWNACDAFWANPLRDGLADKVTIAAIKHRKGTS